MYGCVYKHRTYKCKKDSVKRFFLAVLRDQLLIVSSESTYWHGVCCCISTIHFRMSRILPKYVKRGMWVDQEHGPVMGRIITTDSQTGNIVVALLAVTTAFGMTHLWNLVVFAYHQIRTRNVANGHVRQQQALLRTLDRKSVV